MSYFWFWLTGNNLLVTFLVILILGFYFIARIYPALKKMFKRGDRGGRSDYSY